MQNAARTGLSKQTYRNLEYHSAPYIPQYSIKTRE